jgi:RNA polymerase sigma factor for flagellar operon FliA
MAEFAVTRDSDTTTPAAAPDIEALVREHMPLVWHLVREFLTRVPAHVRREDLASAGSLALVMSARNFDASRGVPFASFASLRIRGAMTDELRAMDWASRAVRGNAREIESVRTKLAASLGHSPDRHEVAAAAGVSVRKLDAISLDVRRASLVSLQTLTPDGTGDLLPNRSDGPEGLIVKREQLGLLRDAIAELPSRQRTVVTRYYLEQRNMGDMAAEIGVCESRVSQIRGEALIVLRAGLQAQDSSAPEPSGPSTRRQDAARAAYSAAIAKRSTLTQRLRVTTLLGEIRSRTTR